MIKVFSLLSLGTPYTYRAESLISLLSRYFQLYNQISINNYVKTVDEVLKRYASRNNVILEQDPMAAPPIDPAAAPPPPVDPAAMPPPPVAPPPPAEEEEEPKKPTSKERADLIQLALDALAIDPSDLEAPEKVVFKNEVNPENVKKKRKQIETIVSYHNGTQAEK